MFRYSFILGGSIYVALSCGCGTDRSTTQQPSKQQEQLKQPEQKDDLQLALTAWEDFIDRAKHNASNAQEYWKQKHDQGHIGIRFAKDDVQKTDSLKAPVSGEVKLATNERTNYSGAEYEYELRFAWKDRRWNYVDGVRLPNTPVEMNNNYLAVLFGPENALLTQQREGRKALQARVQKAWDAFVARAKANGDARIAQDKMLEWRSTYCLPSNLRGRISFLYGDKDYHSGTRKIYSIEFAWKDKRWQFSSGGSEVVLTPLQSLMGLKLPVASEDVRSFLGE